MAALLGAGAAAHAEAPHALRDEQLRELMLRMDALVYEDAYTELQVERERARQSEALAGIAAELAGTADAIAGLAEELDLEAGDRGRFRALADQLYGRALELRGLAERGEYAALEGAHERLGQTCAACHALFRQPLPEARQR